MEKLTIKLKHFKNAAAVGVFFNHRGALPKLENKVPKVALFFFFFLPKKSSDQSDNSSTREKKQNGGQSRNVSF